MRKLFLWVVVLTLMVPLWSYNSLSSIAQDEGTVIADGLNGPMGVLIDESGTVWVIDSGLGGDEEVPFTDAQTGEVGAAKYGETAQVVMVLPDGTQSTFANLPSIVTPSDTIGGARLAVLNGKIYATVGQWLGDASAEAGVPNAGVVAEVNQGSIATVASTWDFERSQNPDGLATDSHPYGLAASPDGALWVTDAGANTLLRVNPLTGRTTLVATFAGVPSPLPSPAYNNELLTDPVPTSVVAKDDMIFVSLLPGFPFIPGSAKVVTVADDGTVSDYATNLTMLTDLQLGPDNELYGVQFAVFGEQGPTPNSGALVRIGEGDTSEVVLEGLSFPTSVSFDSSGDAYLAINGVGAPGSGQVVMYAGIAAGAGEAAAEAADTADVAVTEALTDTATMTDTMVMTDTTEMTDTVETADTAAVTDTMTMTDTDVMTEAMTMADAMAMTDTATLTDTADMSVPSVTASDQESNGTSVVVDQVVAAEQGWIVIHTDVEGKPGPVLGQASVPSGTTDNVIVMLDEPLSGETALWAMLHVDAGAVGTYEFPGADSPVITDGAVTMAPFTATAEEASAAPAEATAEATVEPTPEATPTAAPTTAASAPESMPTTGASATDLAPNTLPVVVLILMALAAGAFVTRRRQA